MVAFGLTALAAGGLAAVRLRTHQSPAETVIPVRKGWWKTIAIIGLAAAGVLAVGGMMFKLVLAVSVMGANNLVAMAGTPPPTDTAGHINVLLLGQGDKGHDGIDLTDTIMVASIDPNDTKSAVLLSLPRDTYVTTEYFGEKAVTNGRRINSLYRDIKNAEKRSGKEEAEAVELSMQQTAVEIGHLLGVDIQGVVKVDFNGFVQIVDALGGVTVDVPQDINDTEYPDENYGYQTFSIAAGTQTLNGETALKYVRSRHSTSDFDRSARQQQVISAMTDQARSVGLLTNPSKITALLSAVTQSVRTTFTVRELIGLAAIGNSLDRSRVVHMQLSDRNGLFSSLPEPGGLLYTPPREQFGGAAVLLPVSIPEFPVTWKQPQTLAAMLFEKRLPHLNRVPVVVLNAGAKSGMGRLLGNELIRYGFPVEDIDNFDGDDVPSSKILATGKASEPLATFLSSLLGMPVETVATEAGQSSDAAGPLPKITVLLGENFAYKAFQDLFSKP